MSKNYYTNNLYPWIKEPEYGNMQDVCKIIAKDIIDGGKNSLAQPPSGI